MSPAAGESRWAIVLATCSDADHARTAQRVLARQQSLSSQLAGAWINSTDKASMVLYGSYPEPGDAQAKGDLQRIKGIVINQRRPFALAYLTPIVDRGAPAAGRYGLREARRQHPGIDPLYTLQVAAWGDFDSGKLSAQEVRRKAEEHAAALRAKGLEAYVHHDVAKRLSIVTVGLFDSTAIDVETGLVDPRLKALGDQFPAHLVNGAPLQEPLSPSAPARGTRVQPPKLVEVPKE